MAAAHGVARVWVGVGGLMATPAMSAVLRTRDRGAAGGAFLLTASHNPGGPTEDFGVKYNCGNGGPAPEKLTDAVFERTKTLSSYSIAAPGSIPLDLSKPSSHDFYVEKEDGSHAGFRVQVREEERGKARGVACGARKKETHAPHPLLPLPPRLQVIDPVEDYLKLLKSVYNFPALAALIARPDFSMVFDGMHGVAGPYAASILRDELGAPASALLNCEPKDDFGGGHPDPNLTYAHDLVARMGLGGGKEGGSDDGAAVPDFGAACDGDADRNMVLGSRFFVTPSDSVAIIAAHAKAAIPYFKHGLKGVARSMPTSAALDRVAAALDVECYEVPTGW
jgi:phosphoglucomutase